jgi:hypothetical protein
MARYEAYGEYDVKYVDDLDSTFSGLNNRARPDSLAPGILQQSNNFRFQREGVAQVRDSITVTKAPLTLDNNTAFTIPFYVYGLPDDDTSTSNTIPVTSMNFGGPVPIFTVDAANADLIQSDSIVSVGAIAGAVDYTPGNYRVVSSSGTSFFINLDGDFSGVAGGATTTVGAPQVQEESVTAVYGSSLFEDPANEGEPYIIIAGNVKAVAVKLSDQSTVDITYDSGAVQIGSEVNLIQAFNRVYIFRKGQTALEWNGDLTGSPNFTKVPNGTFTQPVLLDSINNSSVTNGKVSVAETGHGLVNGDTVVVISAGHSQLVVGDEYRVNVVDDDNFFFYANIDDDGSHTNKYLKRVPQGGGYIHMPGAEYGVFHQDRMVVPFTHNDANPPVSRNILDEILFSQAEQPEVYDPVFGQSRLNQGGDDKVMGLFSFTEDKLLVFMRDSIYSFTNTTNLKNAVKTLLTQEVGLVARRSVVQVGNQVLFLSDNGVYGLSFQDLYNLRGNDKPLSEPIQTTIDTINKEHWHKSVAIYFDNRYYIAVPTGDAQSPNTVLIFNFLNGQWESVDTVGSTAIGLGGAVNWDIQNLIVAGDGNDRGVYAINSLGGIHKLDSSSTSTYDQVITQIGGSTQSVPIDASLRTRQFNFKDIQRKKWNTFELQIASNDDLISDANITFTTENADDVIDLGPLTGSAFLGSHVQRGEDVSIRGRIGNRRAYGCDCTIDVTTGKPKIKVIKVTGGLSFNSTQEVR